MKIVTFFTDNGYPASNLFPVGIQIRMVKDGIYGGGNPDHIEYAPPTGSLVKSGAVMYEIGSGFYGYDFTVYSKSLDYVFIIDGGTTLGNNERYTFGSINSSLVSHSLFDRVVDATNKRELWYHEADKNATGSIAEFNLVDSSDEPAVEEIHRRIQTGPQP